MNSNAASALYLLRESAEPMTTADVAEVVFSPDTTEELRNAERKIRYYFEDGYDYLVSAVDTEDDTVYYDVDDDRLWVGAGAMHVVTLDGDSIEIGFGDVLVYIDNDGVPQTVQLATDSEEAPTVSASESESEALETGF